MEEKHQIGEIMGVTMDKIKEMIDVNTIVGEPIRTPDGITIIPVSKVSMGFASGGSDFATKAQKPEADNAFGGGAGAGVTITPMAFVVIRGESVRMLPVSEPASTSVDRIVELVPDILDRIEGIARQFKDRKTEG